jgi:DNA-binding MarR family transcriptional regulator
MTDSRARRRFRQVGLTESDYAALGEFRRAIRDFLAFSEEAARAYGLTSQQHQALLAIRCHKGAEPITVGELADRLLIKSHSAVGLVSRLEERDLVVRRESRQDRRRAVLELRPRGAEILEAISLRNMDKVGRTSEILEQILHVARMIAERNEPVG